MSLPTLRPSFLLPTPISSLAEGCGLSPSVHSPGVQMESCLILVLCGAGLGHMGSNTSGLPAARRALFHSKRKQLQAGGGRVCFTLKKFFWLLGGEWIVTRQESWLGTNRRTLQLCPGDKRCCLRLSGSREIEWSRRPEKWVLD